MRWPQLRLESVSANLRKIQRMNRMAKKIMIVDDRAVSRHLVRRAATAPQDTVLECVSADEAVKSLPVFQPDCVLLGISQPAPTARAAIKSIRRK